MSQQQPNVTSEVLDTTAAPAVQVVALFHEEVREVAELRTPRAGQRAEFVVGEAPGASFHMAAAACAGLTSLPLVRSTGAGFVLTFLPAWQGEVTLGGVTAPLATVAQGRATASATAPGALELAIPASARISVDVGDVTFIVTSGAPARRYAAPLAVDRGFLGYLAGAAAFAALALGLMNAVPPDASAMSMDKIGRPNVVAELQMKAKDAVDQPEVAVDTSASSEAGSKGGAAKGPGGKLGDKSATADKAKMAIPDRGISPTFANQVAAANQRGREVGIVGALNRMGGDRWALITSKSPIASDMGDRSYDGGWDGEFGDQRGTDWGGGPDGDLWGGNGTKDGTVGNGDYDTIRKGPGDNNDPWTSGDGKPDPVRPKKRFRPETVIGKADADGDMDPAVIQREIRKHRASFEACYERELLVNDSLSGTVDTKFVIMPNGQVRAVRADGVSKGVASCVGKVVASVAFPSTNGGNVNVTYPFSFRKAGE